MERRYETTAVDFGRDSRGRPVYYRSGIFGRGYVLDSEAEYRRLRRRDVWRALAGGLVIAACGVGGGVTGATVALVVALMYYAMETVRFSRGRETVPRRDVREALEILAFSTSPLALGLISAFFLFVLSVGLYSLTLPHMGMAKSLFVVGSGALGAFHGFWMLRRRAQRRRAASD